MCSIQSHVCFLLPPRIAISFIRYLSLSVSVFFFASLSRARSFSCFFMHVFLWWFCLDTFAFYFLYVPLYGIEHSNWNEEFWWICRFRRNTIAIVDGVWSVKKRSSGQYITTARYCCCCCCCLFCPTNIFQMHAIPSRACNAIDETTTIILWKITSQNSRIWCALRSVQTVFTGTTAGNKNHASEPTFNAHRITSTCKQMPQKCNIYRALFFFPHSRLFVHPVPCLSLILPFRLFTFDWY